MADFIHDGHFGTLCAQCVKRIGSGATRFKKLSSPTYRGAFDI